MMGKNYGYMTVKLPDVLTLRQLETMQLPPSAQVRMRVQPTDRVLRQCIPRTSRPPSLRRLPLPSQARTRRRFRLSLPPQPGRMSPRPRLAPCVSSLAASTAPGYQLAVVVHVQPCQPSAIDAHVQERHKLAGNE